MRPTQLFAYGTLRHDQPEHAKYCRGVLGWQPARLRGRLRTVPSGYRLAIVAPAAVLLKATRDAVADEVNRTAISGGALAEAFAAQDGGLWLDGELLTLANAATAWPPIDGWEDFIPEQPGYYARMVVPVEAMEAGLVRRVAAWVYAAAEPPAGALEADR